MGYEDPNLADLVEQIKQASANLDAGDRRTSARLDAITKSVDELYRRLGRPGGMECADASEIDERKDAIGLCKNRRNLTIPKIDAGVSDDYTPTSAEIDEATLCRKAMRSLFRHGDVGRLDHLEKKSLSSFSFGTNGFLLAPEMSNRFCAASSSWTTSAVWSTTGRHRAPPSNF